MACKLIFVSLLCLLGLVLAAKDCKKCDSSECPRLDLCPAGLAQDECGCCEVCAKAEGEECDQPDEEFKHGSCGNFLDCATEGNLEGTCVCSEVGEVCGSNGKTYSSICSLLKATTEDQDLTLLDRAPCNEGPVIKSAPKDTERPLDAILSLDCEATGYPVPTITWELNKEDGSTVSLPNDDYRVSVQVRGGPEKQMATGWVQVLKISRENSGIYTCIATNSKGEARASAKVSLKIDNDSENEL